MRLVMALTVILAAILPASAHEAAPGKPADPARAVRTITIEMSDAMRFTPSVIEVKRGEAIRFVVKNAGQLAHEFVLGTMRDLKAHAEMMKKHPHMHHDEPNMVEVPPGATRELGWRFTQAGEVHFACLIAGHFDAGMVGKITVASSDGPSK